MRDMMSMARRTRRDMTVTRYATEDARWNAQSALTRWQEAPHMSIYTNGLEYEVTPHTEAFTWESVWVMSCPEALEALLKD